MDFIRISNSLTIVILTILGALGIIAITAIAINKRESKEHSTKNKKAMLKELLEGFGLEVPAELKDMESPVIKSVKNS